MHDAAEQVVARENGRTLGGEAAETEATEAPSNAVEPEASGRNRLDLDPERDPSAQGRKLSFLETRADRGIYNPHGLELPVSPYQVMAAVRQMGSQRPEFSCLQVEPGEFGLCFLHAVMGFP
jgi:hypothetical protein